MFLKRLVKFGLKLGLSVLSAAIVFLVLEIGVRVVHPATLPQTVVHTTTTDATAAASLTDALYQITNTGIQLRPNVDVIRTDYGKFNNRVEIKTNQYGFRYPYLGAKTANEFRILVLGDSITLADYANNTDTYPDQLEKALEATGSSIHIEAINAGVSGVGLKNEYAILLNQGLKAEPDVVVLGLYLNDAYESPALQFDFQQVPTLIRQSRLLSFLALRWGLLQADSDQPAGFTEALAAARKEFKAKNSVEEGDWQRKPAAMNQLISDNMSDWGFAWSSEFIPQIQPVLSELEQLLASHNISLVVVIFPVRYQVQAEFVDNQPQQKLAQLLTEMKINYLDLLPILRDKYQQDHEDIYYDQCHYLPAGNQFVGETIGLYLKDQGLVP